QRIQRARMHNITLLVIIPRMMDLDDGAASRAAGPLRLDKSAKGGPEFQSVLGEALIEGRDFETVMLSLLRPLLFQLVLLLEGSVPVLQTLQAGLGDALGPNARLGDPEIDPDTPRADFLPFALEVRA
ncbi:hypothetical protein AbraIFM66950_003958, partial [Aspergillus brasiliensis]